MQLSKTLQVYQHYSNTQHYVPRSNKVQDHMRRLDKVLAGRSYRISQDQW
jgi:hypothetical protein